MSTGDHLISKLLILTLTLVFFTACNEQDFFKKDVPEPVDIIESPIIDPPPPADEQRIDVFIQNKAEVPKVDILWVVDNSGSMQEEQGDLARNFDIFINEFVERDVDFKMAVITTDATSDHDGQMVSDHASLLTAAAAAADVNKFIDDFKDIIHVGINGSTTEVGLTTTKRFMERYNASFLRQNAYLMVVIISDEQEQSAQTVTSLVSNIASYKPSDELLKIYSIVDTDMDVCPGYCGTRYMNASAITGGTSSDIKNDFYGVLEGIGQRIITLLTSFELAEDPIADSIKIYINGAPSTEGWSYDPTSNSVHFSVESAPPEGAEIKVDYLVPGGP
ncbi:MAG: hypothetical protein ISR65_02715 [Bacteriovoracaceae bacterium]|nr:hypothetical protein [Bacteriovoracaceae bacterium]